MYLPQIQSNLFGGPPRRIPHTIGNHGSTTSTISTPGLISYGTSRFNIPNAYISGNRDEWGYGMWNDNEVVNSNNNNFDLYRDEDLWKSSLLQIQMTGASYLKPPGISKTLQTQLEEQAEQELTSMGTTMGGGGLNGNGRNGNNNDNDNDDDASGFNGIPAGIDDSESGFDGGIGENFSDINTLDQQADLSTLGDDFTLASASSPRRARVSAPASAPARFYHEGEGEEESQPRVRARPPGPGAENEEVESSQDLENANEEDAEEDEEVDLDAAIPEAEDNSYDDYDEDEYQEGFVVNEDYSAQTMSDMQLYNAENYSPSPERGRS